MGKNFKKAVCLLTIMAMLLVMAACGSPQSVNENEDTTKGGATQKEEVPEIHFYKDMMNTEGAEAGSDPDIVKDIQDIIQDATGVKVITHFLPSGDEYATKLNMVLASGTQVDAFLCDGVGVKVSNYSNKGVLQPLQDLLKQHAPIVLDSWSKEAFTKLTDKEGNLWGIPREDVQTTWPMFIREDWLKKCGLEYPKTIEEFENVLKVFKEKDPAGNGNTVPLMTFSRYSRYSLLGGFVKYGLSPWLDESSGQIKNWIEAPGVVDYLTTMNRWYEMGYLHKDFASITDYNGIATEVAKGNCGAVGAWYSVTTFRLPLIQQNIPEANYICGPITGPAGLIETYYAMSGGIGTVVTKKCKNPEDFMKVLSWAYDSIENFVISDSGIKDKDWKWADGTTDVVEKISDRKYFYDFRFAEAVMSLEYTLRTLDPASKFHMDFAADGKCADANRAKKPFDIAFGWDSNAISNNVPTLSDIDRLIDQEVIKFMIGERPISEYDKFIKELYDAGMQDWVDEYTRQYTEIMK